MIFPRSSPHLPRRLEIRVEDRESIYKLIYNNLRRKFERERRWNRGKRWIRPKTRDNPEFLSRFHRRATR